tara:strand:+ start:13224 stop:13799 length:576 start_codon:yes stop_codon:yes gene_type:complete
MDNLNKIERFVNSNLNIEIGTNTRKREIVDGRFLFFSLARKCTELSLDKIGKYFGKDHATVLHGVNMFNNVVNLDKKYKDLYDAYVLDHLINSVNDDDNSESANELREIKTNEFKNLNNKISLLSRKNKDLEDANYKLHLKLKQNAPFLDGYYKLTPKEQITVQERLKLIIKLMPSNQKRKEVFEIIKCSM